MLFNVIPDVAYQLLFIKVKPNADKQSSQTLFVDRLIVLKVKTDLLFIVIPDEEIK